MEKKENIFSKLLNKAKKVWKKLGTPDIETGEGIKLTQEQKEELAQIERIREKVHEEGEEGFIGTETVNEEVAIERAKKNARGKNTQKVLGDA